MDQLVNVTEDLQAVRRGFHAALPSPAALYGAGWAESACLRLMRPYRRQTTQARNRTGIKGLNTVADPLDTSSRSAIINTSPGINLIAGFLFQAASRIKLRSWSVQRITESARNVE
ncbi:hypothetical protein BaRGS_00014001 [Batillaria attramentaria]|uniref:Uncharacterized protein n=1 Tax=Batillaria attramentaria TaxID=370345 RepID=A0ABD0L746_9CAEN